jgi:hypothetical protein
MSPGRKESLFFTSVWALISPQRIGLDLLPRNERSLASLKFGRTTLNFGQPLVAERQILVWWNLF